jgi:alpha-galactosidase
VTYAVKCNGIEIALEAELGAFKAELACHDGPQPGLHEVRLKLSAGVPATLPKLTLAWKLPSVDFHYKWNSTCFQIRALDAGTGTENFIKTKANAGMPVYSLYNLEGVNACTFALSDFIHDCELGGSYRNGKFYECRATVFGEMIGQVAEYEIALRFDFRRIPYYQALGDVAAWWETMPGCTPCPTPEAARMPLLSSWYSYNLNIDPDDLEKQCALAKKLGMDTVILDDGWQTNQKDFGYQNNGDWEVNEEKLPDFAAHVKRVQALGMKYMVWFSVPFVGVESRAYRRFKEVNMLLPGAEGARWYSLDPRFAETRRYLAETYENFLRRYGIDGFKMDFICSIGFGRNLPDRPDDRRDCVSIGEAVCKLLDDVTARLRAINPDILIEFRQAYVGPAMRSYGNMLRAVDCPNSIGDNRVRTLDVRLMCRNSVVRADPITWHRDEPAASAAMQIIHAMFSVPQISLRMTELTETHRRMVQQQLSFIRQHRDVLLGGRIRPLYPHLLFPLVLADTDKKLVAAFYAPMPLRLDERIPEQFILVNGTYAPEVLLDLSRPLGSMRMTVTSCTGEAMGESRVDLVAGMNRLAVPAAASAVLTRR